MCKLVQSRFEALLTTQFIGRPAFGANELWDSIGSTSTRGKELAAACAAPGTLILARQQTAGRGRLGKTWESPLDSGIYMSVLLRSENHELGELPVVTFAAGVAVSKAIESVTRIEIQLKWVNDLICHEKKVGGILTEAVGISAPYLVLGIGININTQPDDSRLPDELKSKVTSLHNHTQQKIDPNLLAAEICCQLETAWYALERHDTEQLLSEWKRRSITLGRQVKAQVGEHTVKGLAESINDSGALQVRTTDGQQISMTAGEVQIRLANGNYC